MTYKLWIDDQVGDPDCPNRHCPVGYIPAYSSAIAIKYVESYGVPEFISFDHDLGENDNSMVFLKWLSDHYPDAFFQYNIHSENPIGKANIKSFIESWFLSRTL